MSSVKPEPRKTPWTYVKEYGSITLALIPFAMMVNWVFIPHQVVGGGLTGLCEVIYFSTHGLFMGLFPDYGGAIPVWLSTFVINSALLIIAGLTVGWRFCIRTLWGVLSLTLWYRLIPIRETPLIDDPLLGGIIGGVVFGASLAVVLLNNGSSGGTDIVAMIVNHYWDISLGKVMLLCDLLIIMSAYILPVPDTLTEPALITDFRFKRVMYGVSLTVTYSASIDWLLGKMRRSVQFFIYSKKHAEIATAINTTINRGVTVLDGTGWYSQQPMKVVSVLARKHESQRIIQLVNSIDPNAFISEADVSGVFGVGFDSIKKAKS